MTILIIEDEQPAAKRLKKLLAEIDSSFEILGVAESVSASVEWFRQNALPDVVLMDVQLSDGLSFEIFESVEVTCPIIFTTAFDEYAIRAFQVNSVDYLLKPIETEALRKSLQKFMNLREQFVKEYAQEDLLRLLAGMQQHRPVYKNRFLVRSGQSFIKINTAECAYFYVSNKVTYLVTYATKKHLIDFTLEELEEQLNPDAFFRVNRQFILNIDAITNIQTYFSGKLKLQTNPKAEEEITVSRLRAPEFKVWLEG